MESYPERAGDGEQGTDLSWVIQAGFDNDTQERQELVVLNAKLRTYPHPRLSSGGPVIMAATHADYESCRALAQAALSRPGIRRRLKAPRKWPPVHHYAGLLLRNPFKCAPAVTLEDIPVLGDRGPDPEEYWNVGFGWIKRVVRVHLPDEQVYWFEDPARNLEVGLLGILVEDPLARQQLRDFHVENLGLPPTVTSRLLGGQSSWWEPA